MSFIHDSTGVSPNGRERLLTPNQWYELQIKETREGFSKRGNHMIVCLCKVINNPSWDGTEIKHYVVFLPPDQKGAGISVHFRKCIGEPHGGVDEVNPDNWVGKEFRAFVVSDSFITKDVGNVLFNKIKIVEPIPIKTEYVQAEIKETVPPEEIPF